MPKGFKKIFASQHNPSPSQPIRERLQKKLAAKGNLVYFENQFVNQSIAIDGRQSNELTDIELSKLMTSFSAWKKIPSMTDNTTPMKNWHEVGNASCAGAVYATLFGFPHQNITLYQNLTAILFDVSRYCSKQDGTHNKALSWTLSALALALMIGALAFGKYQFEKRKLAQQDASTTDLLLSDITRQSDQPARETKQKP